VPFEIFCFRIPYHRALESNIEFSIFWSYLRTIIRQRALYCNNGSSVLFPSNSGRRGLFIWRAWISLPFLFRFRFLCRALEAFLLAQMPSNAPLRLEAKAPGYVREPRKVRSTFICQKFCRQVCDVERNGNYSKLDDLQRNGNIKQQATGLISQNDGKM